MRNAAFPANALGSEFKEKLRANFLLSSLSILLGAALGAVFFYAGLQKHLAPFQFAEAVMAYRLFPQSLVGLVAAVLPWVELTAGFFLVLGYLLEAAGRIAMVLGLSAGGLLVGGIKRRSCLLIIAALALVFIIVMSVTMARGLEIDCGCGLFFQRQVGPVPILENILMLLLAAALYWWEYAGE
ncbi:MAG: MauE/DoxX family redox-associated membrane protein [Deltaproteobacteria bacterium]|nr:MauE/DoxX family redox-associated membrane protein [Deltaproteobacteria bacterium]